MPDKTLPDFGNIAMELSRKCNLQCPHCITGANSRIKERLSYSRISSYLTQIKTVSNGVSFTGGEPFIFLDRLKFAVREATRVGLKKGIVTNAFWANSQKKAEYILGDIKKYGEIDQLNISTDRFHERFIPFSNVVNAARACKKLKINTKIRIFHIGFSKDVQYRAVSLIKRRLKKAWGKVIEIHSQPLIVFDGMKVDKRQIGVRYSSRLPVKNSCFALRTIFIACNGDVYPCCAGLFQVRYKEAVILGNINERPLKDILDEAKESFLPNFLSKFGAQGLVRLIRPINNQLSRDLLNNIQNNDGCHLCARLFSSQGVRFLFGTTRNRSGRWMQRSD